MQPSASYSRSWLNRRRRPHDLPNDPISFSCDEATAFNVKPASCLVFQSEQGEIGRLSWEDGIFRFTGNADESAKVFFDALRQMGVAR